MGFILPAPYSPREQVRALMAKKENIEAEIDAHVSVLKANNCTMQSPLVDGEGFPRDDIGAGVSNVTILLFTWYPDIYQVRGARVQIIRLRNDLKAITDDIAKALEVMYDPSNAVAESSAVADVDVDPLVDEELNPKPFAKVDGVAPGSPAAQAVCLESLRIMSEYVHCHYVDHRG